MERAAPNTMEMRRIPPNAPDDHSLVLSSVTLDVRDWGGYKSAAVAAAGDCGRVSSGDEYPVQKKAPPPS